MGTHEITLPAECFSTLRRELVQQVGAPVAVGALHLAGYRAGEAWAGTLEEVDPSVHRDAPGTTFWSRLEDHLRRRGWGALRHDTSHPGVGLLTASDWAEALGADADPEGGCSFSTGLLSGILSRLAGGPVAVLEVRCRTRGDEECAFAFGSEAAIHDLYGRLLEGVALADALGAS